MLHMILGILKIIGIIAGLLLLILLSAVLAAVFVPVRYHLAVSARSGRYAVSLRLGWLLHLITFRAEADSSGSRTIAVRLFGLRLPLSGREGRQQKGSGGMKKSKTAKKRKSGTEKKKKSEVAEKRRPGTEEAAEDKSVKIERTAESPGDTTREEPGLAVRGEPEPESAELPGQEPEKRNILQNIWFQCCCIYDKIKALFRGVQLFIRKLADVKQRAVRFVRRVLELLKKPGQLAALAEEYEAGEVFGGLVEYLLYLTGHYKPRRIQGYLRFGTGDPASTGQLTGLIYILLPTRADRYTVTPEFNEKIFETETVCVGHIRAAHVVRVLWRGFRDRKLRRIITAVRNRPNLV